MGILSGEMKHATLALPDGVETGADVHSPRRGMGRAPLVLVHGTLVSRVDYRAFAPYLADAWGGDVVVYDRRGRDAQHPQLESHSLATEASDLEAVLAQVGSTAVLGHSYGGTVTLMAAGRAPGAFSWVTYDAALNPNGVLASKWRPEFREAIDAGRLDEGFAMLVQGLGTAGAVSRLPLPVLRGVGHALRVAPVGERLYGALPGSLREMESVLAQTEPFPLPPRGLMLNGGLSPAYFHDATTWARSACPGIRSRTLPGLMHNGCMLPLRGLARLVARWLVEHPVPPVPPTSQVGLTHHTPETAQHQEQQ